MANLQDIRGSLLGAMQGLSGGGWKALSGRVVAGYLPVTRTTGSGFWQTATTGTAGSGAFVVVGFGECVGEDEPYGRHPRFACPVDVYCAIDKDAANSGSGVITFIETARLALHAVVNGPCKYPSPDITKIGSVILMHFTLEVEGTGCGT